jgi:carboxylate-amine ligase
MRTLGVEEEFHLVDLRTRRLTGRAPELLPHLSSSYVAEMQRCVVEINSNVVSTLDDLRRDLLARRRTLIGAAGSAGIGIVAAGSVPLAIPTELQVTGTARYRQMLSDYQLLAREQLICGSQVHVGVDDRDEAVAVSQRVAPYLPTLLALSASSPYRSDGTDTGYASARTLVWQRWPTTGLAAPVSTADEYDRLIADLVKTDVITDAGMAYFDVRPANSAPTLELRICDSCPSTDTIVLIAGLFRALVDREITALRAGAAALRVPFPLGRAALWRAARSGLEGCLVDLHGPRSRPAGIVVTDLVNMLRPQLEAVNDWEQIRELSRQQLAAGTSAAGQRLALRRRGRLGDVVDKLIADTAAH